MTRILRNGRQFDPEELKGPVGGKIASGLVLAFNQRTVISREMRKNEQMKQRSLIKLLSNRLFLLRLRNVH